MLPPLVSLDISVSGLASAAAENMLFMFACLVYCSLANLTLMLLLLLFLKCLITADQANAAAAVATASVAANAGQSVVRLAHVCCAFVAAATQYNAAPDSVKPGLLPNAEPTVLWQEPTACWQCSEHLADWPLLDCSSTG